MADPNMLFDINLREESLSDALQRFFMQAERPYIFDDHLEGTVTVKAADLGFQDALKLILPAGFQAVEVDGIYHIRKVPQAA